jgi:hypothetical protein
MSFWTCADQMDKGLTMFATMSTQTIALSVVFIFAVLLWGVTEIAMWLQKRNESHALRREKNGGHSLSEKLQKFVDSFASLIQRHRQN